MEDGWKGLLSLSQLKLETYKVPPGGDAMNDERRVSSREFQGLLAYHVFLKIALKTYVGVNI